MRFRVQSSKLNAGAFTLLEVMVGVVITAIIVTAAAGIWSSCAQGWEFSRTQSEQTQRVDLIVERISNLLQRSLLEKSDSDLFDWQGENSTIGRQAADQLTFSTHWPVEFGDGHTLLLPVRGRLGARLQRTPRVGDSEKKELIWEYYPMTSSIDSSDPMERIVLSDEIESLNIRYWWKESDRWVDGWREKKTWPKAVEVELTFAGGSPATARSRTFVVELGDPVEPIRIEDLAAPPNPEEPQNPEQTGDDETPATGEGSA